VNRHPFALLPALDRRYVSGQICRDSFHESSRSSGGLTNGGVAGNCSPIALLVGPRFVAILGARIVTLPARPRQKAVFDGKPTSRGNSAPYGLNMPIEVTDCVRASSAGEHRRDQGGRYATQIYMVGPV
jgi:hypothetical protein